MDLPDPILVRETLHSLFGEERYRKFVACVNQHCASKQRLFYWQEQIWAKVEEELGIQVGDHQDIASFFRVCHVHGVELQRDRVRIIYGTFRPVPQGYLDFEAANFPMANDETRGPCWVEPETDREVLFCTACREAKSEWRERRQRFGAG